MQNQQSQHIPHADTATTISPEYINALNIRSYAEFERVLYTKNIEHHTLVKWMYDPLSVQDPGDIIQNTIAPRYEWFREQFRDEIGIGIMLEIRKSPDDPDFEHVIYVLDPDDIVLTKHHNTLCDERSGTYEQNSRLFE